ncbi:MgtC/SapB family protein [Pusillimonas sp. CC-YST705]|uniref:Protein MgtC n=1 Tax=Mesopusillimonas faecipullorum TaxID=2755040 RepID=A0ABS8C9J8_9BURK|nr:MgtC/SapB family protein [Mesopusillimonas faecipullorum]MCB5362668.1 MgtC/SapB family protein [Mesopusillimonas faecipullorum]
MPAALSHIELGSLLDSFISLTAAFLLGGLIGLERQFRLRTAGLRTNVLVAVGAALFVDTATRFHLLHGGSPNALQVLAYVVSGVGFLGAGVIMREEGNVRGINTAATLWGSAAVGGAAGLDLLAEAIMGTLFVLSANILLRPVVDHINRRPMNPEEVEATYTVHVIADEQDSAHVLTQFEEALKACKLPTRDKELRAFGEEKVEIEVRLLPVSLLNSELDALIGRLRRVAGVQQVFWRASTSI